MEYARANPGKITFAVPNAGAPPQLAMEWVGRKEKINWKAVPFKGLAPAVPALLGGHVSSIAGLAGVVSDLLSQAASTTNSGPKGPWKER